MPHAIADIRSGGDGFLRLHLPNRSGVGILSIAIFRGFAQTLVIKAEMTLPIASNGCVGLRCQFSCAHSREWHKLFRGYKRRVRA